MGHAKKQYRAWQERLSAYIKVCGVEGCRDFCHQVPGANKRWCKKHQKRSSREGKPLRAAVRR